LRELGGGKNENNHNKYDDNNTNLTFQGGEEEDG